MSEVIVEKPRCDACCNCGAIYFETETRAATVQKWGAIFPCVGDVNEGKVYATLAQGNSGPGTPPDCGGTISYYTIGGAVQPSIHESNIWDPHFGTPGSPTNNQSGVSYNGPAPAQTGASGTGVGDVIVNSFSDEVTDGDHFSAVAAAVSAATPTTSSSVPTDILDYLDGRTRPTGLKIITYSVSRFKWRHAPPFMDVDGRIRGTCWKALFEFLKVSPLGPESDVVVDSFNYEWDGTLPEGFDPEDETTYPGQYSDWIDMPTLAWSDDVGAVMTLRVTVTCRCTPSP